MVWPSSINSKEAAVSVEPGSCSVLLVSFPFFSFFFLFLGVAVMSSHGRFSSGATHNLDALGLNLLFLLLLLVSLFLFGGAVLGHVLVRHLLDLRGDGGVLHGGILGHGVLLGPGGHDGGVLGLASWKM